MFSVGMSTSRRVKCDTKMDLDNVERQEKSEYSMDFTLFWRLGQIQFWADNEQKSLNVYSWFNSLLVLYGEIAPIMKPDQRLFFTEKIRELLPFFNSIKKEIKETDSFYIDYNLYNLLLELSIQLKIMMVEKGIYLKRKDDASFGFK